MIELELATTEQILEELAKRPIDFVFVSMFAGGEDTQTGYLAHSPHLDNAEAISMLQRAEEFLAEPLEGEPREE